MDHSHIVRKGTQRRLQSNKIGPFRLFHKLLSHLRHLTAQQWSLLLIGLAVGVILLLLAGANPKGIGPSILREAGIVTIGTVLIALLYEFSLRRTHDEELLAVVTRGLLGRAHDCGLSRIEIVDFAGLFRQLEARDELWWLDTYCPDMSRADVQDEIRRAIQRGAKLRILVIDPDSFTADARAEEIEVDGYTHDNFQEGARTNLRIVERIKHSLPDGQADRLEVVQYSDLPCAPMYLRLRDGQPVDGWTSYFLTRPTYEVAHFNWRLPGAVRDSGTLSPGLGLGEFKAYFEAKWRRALTTNRSSKPVSDVALEQAHSVFRQLRLRDYKFVIPLLIEDMERVIQLGANALGDGKLRREQNSKTRELLLTEASGHEILLVHSPSENRIFEAGAPAFWQAFHEQLVGRVESRDVAGVRRLFVVDDFEQTSDETLAHLIAYHKKTDRFGCRVLTRAVYDEIQQDKAITRDPIHDFGVYGSVAYIWQRAGYSQPGTVRGYFQVDRPTVDKYRELFQQCWKDGDEPV